MEIENKEVEPIYKESATIKLSRGMKGTYGWEIKILGSDVKELKKVNDEMCEEYGNEKDLIK